MIRLALRVGRADAELVLAELLELAPTGVEEVDLPGVGGTEELVEYAVYGTPGELPNLPDLQALAGGVRVEVASSELPDDWSERWKRFHRPVLIEGPVIVGPVIEGPVIEGPVIEGPACQPIEHAAHDREGRQGSEGSEDGQGSEGGERGGDTGAGGGTHGGESPPGARARARTAALHVRPPWEPPSECSDVIEIVIDPAQAFGTGAHPTTRLCLELLLALAAKDPERGMALDVGAGSGVLAIAAAKLGYHPVIALDNDPLSIDAIEVNATTAGVQVESRLFDLRAQSLPIGAERDYSPSGPIILANLLRPLLLDLVGAIEASPAHLIASGLMCEEAEEIAGVFARRLGLCERERRDRGGWAALWLTRA